MVLSKLTKDEIEITDILLDALASDKNVVLVADENGVFITKHNYPAEDLMNYLDDFVWDIHDL